MSMYKNRLQEYAQRSALPLPVYTTVSEGQSHDPKFRSKVAVDGRSYTSGNTFSACKAAEQDAARVALECIESSIRNDGCSLGTEDLVLSKSILHEFAAKMYMEKPIYHVLQLDGQHSGFKCALQFNGETFSGEIGRNKKEAERLAARDAIASLLGDFRFGTCLSEVIRSKSKSKFNAAMKKKDEVLETAHQESQFEGDSSTDDEDEEFVSDVGPGFAIFKPTIGQQPLQHEVIVPKPESSSQNIALTITFVPQGHPVGADGQGYIKRESKSRKKKSSNNTQ